MNRRPPYPVRLLLALAGLALAAPAAAQPYLLRDIRTEDRFGDQTPASSSPRPAGSNGTRVVFRTIEPEGAVWGTDGTAAGTARLPFDDFDGRLVGTVGDRMIFANGFHPETGGRGLWSTDGTPTGSEQLTFHDLTSSFGAERVGNLDGRLLFSLPGPGGSELWATDGSLAGTGRIRDLLPGALASAPGPGAAAGEVLLFPARAADAGRELWRSDGTADGTELVADLRAGADGSNPEHFTSFGARALFIADDGVTGTELWISDGTAGGTRRVIDLTPGAGGTVFVDGPLVVPAAGAAYVLADDGAGPRLWRTDGTAAGTVALSPPFQSTPGPLHSFEGRAIFTAATAELNEELWVSDGTPAGTQAIDLCPGPCTSSPGELEPSSFGLVLGIFDPEHGFEPYLTDGTPEGTYQLADLCPGSCRGYVGLAGEAGGRLLLFGGDFLATESLWASSGGAGDAIPLLQSGVTATGIGASLGQVGSRLLFSAADDEHGEEPWRSDGTAEGTEAIVDLVEVANLGSVPDHFHRLEDVGLFIAHQNDQTPLWRTDGSIAGTLPVAPLVAGPRFGSFGQGYRDFAVAGQRLFIAGMPDPDEEKVAVWSTDGTTSGTHALFELPNGFVRLEAIGDEVLVLGPELWRTGPSPGSARRLAEVWCTSRAARTGGVWVFGATPIPGGDSTRELWATDGTAAGTRRLKDIYPGLPSSDPGDPVSFGGRAWFAATDAEHGRELWSTDGTEAGTLLLVDLAEGPSSADPHPLAVIGGRLVFIADVPDDSALWATDGTAEGTVALAPAAPSPFAAPRIVGGAMYWLEGRTLWRSDGTPEGTGRVTGLLPSVLRLESVARVGDRLALAAISFHGGWEIWLSDGTPGGTRRAVGADLGLTSLSPLGILGDFLVFTGNDPAIGSEPWAVHLGDRPGPFAPPESPSALAAEPLSPTAVQLSWRDHAPDEERFRIEVRTPHGPRGGPLLHPADVTEALVGGLEPGVPVSFRVRAENALGASEWSGEAAATPEATPPGPCAADDPTLCLLGGRFALRVSWRDQRSGDVGIGHAVPYPGSQRTGTFWFFDPANVELIVKTLDGRPVNGAFWSFFGGLSDVEYWVTVTDTADRRSRTYYNPPGRICGVGDTAAFPEAGPAPAADAAVASLLPPGAVGRPAAVPAPLPGTAGACQPGPETLCLLDGRLKVEVAWDDHHNGGSGPGRAVPGTDKTGYFWFFSSSNVELVVKALDGTPVNGHLWVFWGALTDVEYTITVTDVETGVPVEYHNPPGEICGGADTTAF